MRALYERVLETDIYGSAQRPAVRRLHRRGEPREPPRHGAREVRARRAGRGARRARREGLLLRRSGPPDVLRELHEPRADGAPRLAARVAAARRRGDPRRLHPADLPRGHAQRHRRDGRLQAVARLPRDDEQVRHPADVPARHARRRCRRAATCRSAASASRRTSGRSCRTRTSRSSAGEPTRSEQYRAITLSRRGRDPPARAAATRRGRSATPARTPMAECLAAQRRSPSPSDEASA